MAGQETTPTDPLQPVSTQISFLRTPKGRQLRRHFRGGLRSHLFELIRTKDLDAEAYGTRINNILIFPRAKPLKMLRILRNRFNSPAMALEEIKKYRILLKFLGTDLVAASEEFIVEHHEQGLSQILLCGLQEYVEGTILDPWHLSGQDCLGHFYTPDPGTCAREFIQQAVSDISNFVTAITAMIKTNSQIPDLAGDGNLMLTPQGRLKLVDINNIVIIQQGPQIQLDDKGYPCCDKSVEVLSILAHKILNRPLSLDAPFYQRFLAPDRKQRVRKLEQQFYQSLQ